MAVAVAEQVADAVGVLLQRAEHAVAEAVDERAHRGAPDTLVARQVRLDPGAVRRQAEGCGIERGRRLGLRRLRGGRAARTAVAAA